MQDEWNCEDIISLDPSQLLRAAQDNGYCGKFKSSHFCRHPECTESARRIQANNILDSVKDNELLWRTWW